MRTIKRKKPVVLTIEKDPIEEALKPRLCYYANGGWLCYPSADLSVLGDYEIRILRFSYGDPAIVIETVFTFRSSIVPRWLRYIDHDHRKRRAPLLVSLSFYTTVAGPHWRTKAPPRFEYPIRVVSICVGGSHCLVYELADPNVECDAMDFVGSPFRGLLEDRRIAVVGIGMRRFAEQAREEWGVHVANPVDLRSVIDEAIGKGKVEPGRMMDEVEEMAEVVLDGFRVKKKPRKIKDLDFGCDEVTEEALMYATRDSYLAFEIGKKCFEMIGRKTCS